MKKVLFFIFICVLSISVVYAIEAPNFDISHEYMNCATLLGPNLVKIVKAFIKILQIAAAIIAIVYGMVLIIPAVVSKDADALKKSTSKVVVMFGILLVILILPVFINVIGNMLDFDTTCIF